MSSTFLIEYEIWKRRQTTRLDSDIKNYFADGIEIGERLLRLGCAKDREGLDIREQVDILRARITSIEQGEE